jgi:hypothetical protein
MARKQHLLGEINLLGLGFGGSPLSFYGTLIGGGVAGVTSMTLGHVSGGTMAANRERWGLVAGLGTAGLLAAMKSTRSMAGGAVVGAFLASGLSWLEKVLLGTVQLPAATAATAAAVASTGTAGMGMAKIRALNGGLGLRRQPDGTYLNGLGIAQARALNGGLGLATVAAQPQSRGTIPGVHGPGFAGTQFGNAAPVSLLGRPSERSTQVSLLGGPPIHGLSAAYGATLLGQGR